MLALFCWIQARMATREEKGATAVEYGMIVALIAAVIVVAVTALGTQVNVAFNKVVNALPAA